jgi:hypothetical protein
MKKLNEVERFYGYVDLDVSEFPMDKFGHRDAAAIQDVLTEEVHTFLEEDAPDGEYIDIGWGFTDARETQVHCEFVYIREAVEPE